MVKHLAANAAEIENPGSIPGSGRSPGGGHGYPGTPVLLPGKSHGQRSLVGYSSWGLKELDTTEGLTYLSLPRTALTYLVFKPFSLQACCH